MELLRQNRHHSTRKLLRTFVPNYIFCIDWINLSEILTPQVPKSFVGQPRIATVHEQSTSIVKCKCKRWLQSLGEKNAQQKHSMSIDCSTSIVNRSINQSIKTQFVKRRKSRANRRRVKRKATYVMEKSSVSKVGLRLKVSQSWWIDKSSRLKASCDWMILPTSWETFEV